jgi:hypothetical protein
VIENTVREKLPEGFQRSEFLMTEGRDRHDRRPPQAAYQRTQPPHKPSMPCHTARQSKKQRAARGHQAARSHFRDNRGLAQVRNTA